MTLNMLSFYNLNNMFVDLLFTISKHRKVITLPNVKKLNKYPNVSSEINYGDALVYLYKI